VEKNVNHLKHAFPAAVEQSDALSSCFSSPKETTRGMEMVGGSAVKEAPALSQLLAFEPKSNMLVEWPEASHLTLLNHVYSFLA